MKMQKKKGFNHSIDIPISAGSQEILNLYEEKHPKITSARLTKIINNGYKNFGVTKKVDRSTSELPNGKLNKICRSPHTKNKFKTTLSNYIHDNKQNSEVKSSNKLSEFISPKILMKKNRSEKSLEQLQPNISVGENEHFNEVSAMSRKSNSKKEKRDSFLNNLTNAPKVMMLSRYERSKPQQNLVSEGDYLKMNPSVSYQMIHYTNDIKLTDFGTPSKNSANRKLEVKTKTGHDFSHNVNNLNEKVNPIRKSICRQMEANHVKSKAFIDTQNNSQITQVYDESEVDETNMIDNLVSPIKKIATLNFTELDKTNLFPKSAKFCCCRILEHNKGSISNDFEPEQIDDNNGDDLSSDSDNYFVTSKNDEKIQSQRAARFQDPEEIKIWGAFWKHTPARIQSYIISTILKAQVKNRKLRNYTEVLKCCNGKLGEEKFLISAKWWREWCDYVNFESMFDDPKQSMRASRITVNASEASEVNLDDIQDNFGITDRANSDADSTVYNKPGFIDNQCLITKKSLSMYRYHIEPSLQEHFDFVVVNASAWAYLSSWYNYDYSISKELVQNIVNVDSWMLNLYPEENENLVEIARNPSFYCRSGV